MPVIKLGGSFERWNDPDGNPLVAIKRDGTIETQGIEFADGTSQNTGAAPAPGVIVLVLGDTITSIQIAQNVLTVPPNNAPPMDIGKRYTFTGLTTATFLNGLTLACTGHDLNTGGSNFNFTHANYPSAADTGAMNIENDQYFLTAEQVNSNSAFIVQGNQTDACQVIFPVTNRGAILIQNVTPLNIDAAIGISGSFAVIATATTAMISVYNYLGTQFVSSMGKLV